MLNIEMIKSSITADSVLKEVTLEKFNTTAFVKKFTRKDSTIFSTAPDMVSTMVYVGIVDANGSRIFESAEQVAELKDDKVLEMFNKVNDFNSDSVEKQAKK